MDVGKGTQGGPEARQEGGTSVDDLTEAIQRGERQMDAAQREYPGETLCGFRRVPIDGRHRDVITFTYDRDGAAWIRHVDPESSKTLANHIVKRSAIADAYESGAAETDD